jgi:alanine racemase
VRRAVARVNLAAIERNCRRLREALSGHTAFGAVVKANAYGHGMVPVAQAAQRAGASWLCVATAGEAVGLREAGLTDARVLVMGALSDPELREALAADADIVVWRESAVDRVRQAGGARVHVKLDTGMGRLGTADVEEAKRVADRVAADPQLTLAGLMTHFATADEAGDDHFPRQLGRFTPFVAELRTRHRDLVAHAANSAATLRDAAAHFDLVRCGIAVYGLDPANRDPDDAGLEPALTLESYVAEVKPLPAGESAGYGRRFRPDHPTRIAIVPIGYADGVRRGLTNVGHVLVRGRRHRIAGAVSMDNLAIEVAEGAVVEPGDRAVLIGADGAERITAEEVAGHLDTINYEVVCGISGRVPRVYERDGVEETP